MSITMNTNEFAAQLLSTLKNADESYLADVFQALERGMPLFNSRKELSEPVKPKKEKTVKVKKEEKEKEDLPEASSGAPDASAYRMSAASIDISTCVARITKDGEDKRWSPAVYRERQCGKEVTENGLCKTCSARAEKYEGKAGAWLGRVTEEPLEWVHMLGTEWAEKKKPVFKDADKDADAESVGIVSAQEMKPEEKEKEKEEKAKKVAKPKPSEEEKAAAKAAAKAAKEAEKEAAKAAAKAAKEAAKEAEKAAKAAKEAEKKPAEKKAVKKAVKAVKAEEVKVVEAAVEEVTGEMGIIDGTVYFARNGNVYNYSELDEEIGSYVGRLVGEFGKPDCRIDTEADEVTAAESESD
jgi:chemotaxis protein histidine kinase CheA